jgi:hypothetical protein
LQIDDCGFWYFNLQSQIVNLQLSRAGLPCHAKRVSFDRTLTSRGHGTTARVAGQARFFMEVRYA